MHSQKFTSHKPTSAENRTFSIRKKNQHQKLRTYIFNISKEMKCELKGVRKYTHFRCNFRDVNFLLGVYDIALNCLCEFQNFFFFTKIIAGVRSRFAFFIHSSFSFRWH